MACFLMMNKRAGKEATGDHHLRLLSSGMVAPLRHSWL